MNKFINSSLDTELLTTSAIRERLTTSNLNTEDHPTDYPVPLTGGCTTGSGLQLLRFKTSGDGQYALHGVVTFPQGASAAFGRLVTPSFLIAQERAAFVVHEYSPTNTIGPSITMVFIREANGETQLSLLPAPTATNSLFFNGEIKVTRVVS